MSLVLDRVTVQLSARTILAPTSLEVVSGEMVGITAPSGAGKSTLLSVASLLQPPSSGRVVINKSMIPHKITGASIPADIRQSIGLLPQNPRSYADPRLTLEETICTPISFRDGKTRPKPKNYRELISEWCDAAQLPQDLLRRLPSEVSDGQLQRALLARSISLDPAILLCDEPTSALDPKTTSVVFALLSARAAAGACVVIASHDQASLISSCDRVVMLGELQQETRN
ncbi:ATP-binding cassette domain-containing protein [Glutamicibacter sp. JC586]|uniref:ATP-binding cassette domain-containing protein n=1 Tax=Glutamicibacter sp. JC586 TaxID=2590552 RepID=UPI001356DA95|nr:ATP-binding cassette domain-containing protein [Glutamicibacter sp. JC586]